MDDVLSEKLISWVATRGDEAVLDYKKGYYPFEIVAEAFEKGVTTGEESFKERVRQQFYDKAKLAIEAFNSYNLSLVNKGYKPSKVFVRHTIEKSDFILVIDENTHNSDAFIDLAYSEASRVQSECHEKELNIDISFVDDNEHLNPDLIKSDGFGFSFDFTK